MSWATGHIAKLLAGETVQFRPRGNSMTPRIDSGDLCTVRPVRGPIHVGDIVLCKVGRSHYLHLVSSKRGERYQISNNHGHVNGWVSREAIYGTLWHVE